MKCAFPLIMPRRRSVALLLLTSVPHLTLVAGAQPAQLRPGQVLYAGDAPLDPGDYAIPCATDWNGDGRKDLIVGYRYADKVALYLNVGSDASPALTNLVNLQAGGVDIYLPSGGCGAPAPFVCDYDNDGKRDLLVGDGNYPTGYVYFYRNTNTDAAPILAPGVTLMVGASPLSVGYRATPCVDDWDGDGLKDLICGNGDGFVFFFKNTGTAQSPAYAASTRIQAGGADLNLGIRSVARIFDWDGDGVKDLVGSSNDGVYWCRNMGSNSSPNLLARVGLRAPPVSGSGLVPINTGGRMRLDLVDWNNDGTIDLLIGNLNGTVSYYEGYRFGFTQMTALSPGQHVCEWNSASNLTYQVLGGDSLSSITNPVVTNVASGGTTTRWTNSITGGQQFYRLQIAQ
jgi:hypothetical protein